MQIKELKMKSKEELTKLLAAEREKWRDLVFKDSQRQLKNVREIRKTKKTIARILTILNSKKDEKNI